MVWCGCIDVNNVTDSRMVTFAVDEDVIDDVMNVNQVELFLT